MNRKLVVGVACLLAAILVGVATTAAAQQAAPVIPLTANGEKLLVHYAEMLRNYRPDHIHTADYRWRYVKATETEVKYGSQDQKNDLPSLHYYQNIINNDWRGE